MKRGTSRTDKAGQTISRAAAIVGAGSWRDQRPRLALGLARKQGFIKSTARLRASARPGWRARGNRDSSHRSAQDRRTSRQSSRLLPRRRRSTPAATVIPVLNLGLAVLPHSEDLAAVTAAGRATTIVRLLYTSIAWLLCFFFSNPTLRPSLFSTTRLKSRSACR
jgi:hypothetical protein